MHALDFPNIHATLDNVIVEFVEESSGRELGAWEGCQRVGKQAVDEYADS